MRANTTDDSGGGVDAESADRRVPAALGELVRGLVLRKLAWVLSALLVAVALLEGSCLYALVDRRPNVIYVPESTLLGPVLVEEEVKDGE